MSQHIYRTHYAGAHGAFPVKITVGWDRPLQGFFCNVESEPLERLIYCNLDDKALRGDGMAARLVDIESRLADLGLHLPQAICAQVQKDADDNIGTKVVDHGADLAQPDPKGRDAVLSLDKRYRYALWRRWGLGGRTVCFIMFNPSTADALQDDATIRRITDFAKRWGYDALFVSNLFALRSKTPQVVLSAVDPVGTENDHYLTSLSNRAHLCVAAWGALGGHHGRDLEVRRMVPLLHYLSLTQEGQPAHPLYLKGNLKPVYWPTS